MSDIKRQFWANLSDERRAEIKSKISKNHARSALGKTGPQSSSWKGGKYITKRDGYVHIYAPDHPKAKRNSKGGGGYVLEHRLVVEKILGRYLKDDEDVNHVNGDKTDNRPENLVVVRHHAHYHEMTCPNCDYTFRTR